MVDERRWIQLRENFIRQKFQWVKTDHQELLGKVVTCKEIEPMDALFFAVFDDGSKIDTTKLNSNLMMINGDTPPLTMEEINAIYRPIPSATKKEAPQTQNTTQAGPIQTTPTSGVNTPNIPNANVPTQPPQKKVNMFEMFNSESSVISLNINAKLPDKRLLKMMYSSAENKEVFLSELSEYLLSLINKQVVHDSISSMLNPAPIKKEKKESGDIKLTEVDGRSK